MAMKLLTTNTSSNAASSSFTSSIDSTYKLYIFKWYDVNPATDGAEFTVNFSTDAGSNYNMTKTTTLFRAYQNEAGDDTALGYVTSLDLAQSTDYQPIAYDVGNGADESAAGILWLFNPSNTTYVKHFYSRANVYNNSNLTVDVFVGGYVNSTNDIDAVDFKMSSGNMDGVIKMYGVG